MPTEGGADSAAREFESQEASYVAAAAAESAAAPPTDEESDRPLTGAKPPTALDAAEEDRPLGGGKGKDAWEPPSEFPPGHKNVPERTNGERGGSTSAVPGGETVSLKYMTSMG